MAVFGSGWDWVSDSDASGSATITAMQNWLGVSADGLIGRQTFSALGSYEDPELSREIDELNRELGELGRFVEGVGEDVQRKYEDIKNKLKELYEEVVRKLQDMLDKLSGKPDPEARKWFEEHR